jgi:hypothetical protein
MSASLIMASVALLCTIGALFLFLRPAQSEAAVYRHRIAATMLASAALALAGSAWALHGLAAV